VDQETARYETPPVPLTITDDEVTVPVDVGEMEAAAAASRRPGDPSKKPHTIARSSTKEQEEMRQSGADLVAEVQISGTAQVAVLPVRNISPTGFSVEVPKDRTLHVRQGAAVMVAFRLRAEIDSAPKGERLRAHVTHHRKATRARAGGMALRWDLEDHQSCAALESVLRAVKG